MDGDETCASFAHSALRRQGGYRVIAADGDLSGGASLAINPSTMPSHLAQSNVR